MEIITPQDYQNNARKRQRRSLRPCDACRKRKTRCVTKDGDGDCVHCRLRATACTFQHGPPERQVTTSAGSNSAYSGDEQGGEAAAAAAGGSGAGGSGGRLDDLPGPGVGGPGGGISIGIGHQHYPRSTSSSQGSRLQPSQPSQPSETQTQVSETLSIHSSPAETQASDDTRENHCALPSVIIPEHTEPDTLEQTQSHQQCSLGSDMAPAWIYPDEGQLMTFHSPHDTPNPALPHVLFIGIGGTIAGVNHRQAKHTAGVVGIKRLVENVLPQLSNICNVWCMQIANADTTDSTILGRLRLGVQIGLNNPNYAGIVVWDEMSTLEVTAQYIALTTLSDRPVILTGAVRLLTDLSPDGPVNLLDSAVVASSADSMNRGALVVLNSQIHSASMIIRQDSSGIDAFTSESPVGKVHNSVARFFFGASLPTGHRYFKVNGVTTLPRVKILYALHGDLDDDLAVLKQIDAQGFILAGYWKERAVSQILAIVGYDIPIRTTRTTHGFDLSGYDSVKAEDLSPSQARVKLQVVITAGMA